MQTDPLANGSSEPKLGPSSFEQRLAASSNRSATNALAAAGEVISWLE